MSSVAQTEARHRRLSTRSRALARRDYFESIRRTTVLAAHAPALLAQPPIDDCESAVGEAAATRLVGALIVAGLIATLWFFRQPLIAALTG